MSLVTYPDSDSSTPPSPGPTTKKLERRKRATADEETLPSLPGSFHSLYATRARTSTSDDPSLHDGRQRSTPHIEGNWPSHVYIEWIPSPAQIDCLTAIVDSQDRGLGTEPVRSLLRSELGALLPLHISLSQTLNLASDQRDEFVSHLRTELSRTGVEPFVVHPQPPRWAANFSQTRHFLVLPLEMTCENHLSKLLQACNIAAKAFSQPPLYARSTTGPALQDQFHVSIAWSLKPHDGAKIVGKGDDDVEPDPSTVSLGNTEADGRDDTEVDARQNLQRMQIAIRTVKAKVGNNIVEYDLRRLSKPPV